MQDLDKLKHVFQICAEFEVKKHQQAAFIKKTIEGLRAKRAYIAFLADFHFLQDRANFWQTDLF